jgi:hypothetical protein
VQREDGPRVDLVLHVGMGKTGTSSVQYLMRDNRERLASLGLLYPKSPGAARHGRIGLFTKSPEELRTAPEWARQDQTDPQRFRRVVRRRLLAEVERSGLPRVLLSDEVLFGSSEAALRRLRRLTSQVSRALTVVAYLRRQDDHMVSRYQQGVKIGWVQRLEDWASEDMTHLYDYATRLRTHRRVLAPDALVVRRYEPGGFDSGSLFQDFLDAAGIEVRASDLTQVPDRNKSLDAESVEALRLLNVHRVRTEGARPGMIDNRELVGRLTESATGPTLTLPGSTLDAWMVQWEESNRVVAGEFLDDERGELFRAPRRTRNTTTEQYLDPDRVDHFADLLELPGDVRASLRRLAEQEARGR